MSLTPLTLPSLPHRVEEIQLFEGEGELGEGKELVVREVVGEQQAGKVSSSIELAAITVSSKSEVPKFSIRELLRGGGGMLKGGGGMLKGGSGIFRGGGGMLDGDGIINGGGGT